MKPLIDRNSGNAARFDPKAKAGHYESWFQRGNHPTRPLSFWLRYTVFSPQGSPEEARGELWAVYFDGESQSITAVKEALPIAECAFSNEALSVQIGTATLSDGFLQGTAKTMGKSVAWNLNYTSPEPPLLLLPAPRYDATFPKAKALVGSPNAAYTGTLQVEGQTIAVNQWVGSQNHNWGQRHTDHYAWGQVAGFDDAPDAFLELTTARVRIGPVYSPFMTLAVLRLDGREYCLNSLARAPFAKARFEYFDWSFARSGRGARLQGRIHAPRKAFVALRYDNPPGGSKTCLNTKLATCELRVRVEGRAERTLHTQHRAAFEILTCDDSHGLVELA